MKNNSETNVDIHAAISCLKKKKAFLKNIFRITGISLVSLVLIWLTLPSCLDKTIILLPQNYATSDIKLNMYMVSYFAKNPILFYDQQKSLKNVYALYDYNKDISEKTKIPGKNVCYEFIQASSHWANTDTVYREIIQQYRVLCFDIIGLTDEASRESNQYVDNISHGGGYRTALYVYYPSHLYMSLIFISAMYNRYNLSDKLIEDNGSLKYMSIRKLISIHDFFSPKYFSLMSKDVKKRTEEDCESFKRKKHNGILLYRCVRYGLIPRSILAVKE